MKRLSDADIEQMAGAEFAPDLRSVNKSVRAQLRLRRLIGEEDAPVPEHAVIDLHQHTEEQAWNKIMNLATSGVRTAVIITGASGILKIKFQQWARDSILAPHILSWKPVNNGSFAVRFRRKK